MDKRKNIFFAAVIIAALFSCKNAVKEKQDAAPEPVPEIQESFLKGLVLSETASLCLLGRDNKMHSILTLNGGTYVSLLLRGGEADVTESEGLFYYHAVYEDCDFWIKQNTLAVNSVRAVITEKTALFADAALTEPLKDKKPLAFGTPVSLQEQPEGLVGFSGDASSAKIFYFDKASCAVDFAFIPKENVSGRIDDIVVSDVVNSLKVTKRESVRTQLWAKAAKYNPCPKVAAALEEQKIQKVQYDYKEVVKSLKKTGMGVNIDELMTVDQSKDPFKK